MKHTTILWLLGALLASSPACKRTQAPTPPPTPPPAVTPSAVADSGPTGPALAPGADAAEFRDAARVLPRVAVGSFRQTGPVLRSTAANLFQFIDGDAVSYQAYGVRQYAKTDYRKPNTSLVVTVSAYEFADALGAWGRYSQNLSTGRDPASLEPQAVRFGAAGFQGRTQLVFVKETFLIQVDISDESEESDENALFAAAREVLPAFAGSSASLAPGHDTPPATPLIPASLVWGGATYVSQAVLGVDSTGAGWVGWYRDAQSRRYRAAVFERQSAAEAVALCAALRGRAAQTVVAPSADEAFAVTLATAGETVVLRRGTTVVAVTNHGADADNAPASQLSRAEKLALAQAQLAHTLSARDR
ncbi:MAG: hypothetical protein Q8Q09_24100 [Deltaproteobacteria bacterium]|nr:hypothetical protein [Deltaproteobacteria bacterium]